MTERTSDEFAPQSAVEVWRDDVTVPPVKLKAGHDDDVEPDYSAMTLDELAEAAVGEAKAIAILVGGALEHNYRLGKIFLAARRKCATSAEWSAWLDSGGWDRRSSNWRSRLMRLAHYAPEIPLEAWEPYRDTAGNLREASLNRIEREYLARKPHVNPAKRLPDYPTETRQVVKRLHKEGVSLNEISRIVGASRPTVQGWINPDVARATAKKRQARIVQARRAEAALREKERKEEALRLAKANAGTSLSNAWGDMVKVLSHLSKAELDSTGAQAELVTKAITACHAAERAIQKALQATRAD